MPTYNDPYLNNQWGEPLPPEESGSVSYPPQATGSLPPRQGAYQGQYDTNTLTQFPTEKDRMAFEQAFVEAARYGEEGVGEGAEAGTGGEGVGRSEADSLAELCHELKAEFDDAEAARSMVNLRWLDDLMQYRGMYDGAILERIRKNGGSKAFYRLTTAKVNTMTARLMDLLFPQRVKNWAIEATPDPMLPDDVLMEELQDKIVENAQVLFDQRVQELMMQGIMLRPEDGQQLMQECQINAFQELNTQENRVRVSKIRAKRMEQVIDDQLKEGSTNGQIRPSWRQNCRDIVKSACLYGMGVLKGPLIEQVSVKKYVKTMDEYGRSNWEEQVVAQNYRPYHESVSIWEIYPDPGARIPSELRYVWQRHIKTDKDLRELFHVPGFDNEKIKRYMLEHPDGDAELTSWEEQVRQLNADNESNGGTSRLKKRYLLLERWGYLTGRELADAGVALNEDEFAEVFPSCVWMLGDYIIKASINPMEGIDIPYHFYPYQSDDSSFWPEGIAAQLRTPQSGVNSAVRAMQDNANLSCGPIHGINIAHLAQGQSLADMRAGKVFLIDNPNVKINDVMQSTIVPSAIEHNLSLTQFWCNVADEVSTPRFNQGDSSVKGAGETASGLSMLMGASNILLKDHVKDFDDNVVSPFIRAMFHWNMRWNERDDIKGDFEVIASGSQSLIAKEVRAQQIPALIQYLGVPLFEPYLKAKELLEVALEQTDLPAERIMRTDDEAEQYKQQQLMEQAQAQAQAEVQALMEQLQKMGMPEEMIRQQLMQILGQTMMQGPQMGAPQGGEDSASLKQQVTPQAMNMQGVPDAPPDPTPPAPRAIHKAHVEGPVIGGE